MATKCQFLERTYYYNSINAAVQRNSPYGGNALQKTKAAIRRELRRQLATFVDPFLTRSVNDPVVMPHYRNVGWSSDEAAFLSAVHQLRDAMSTVLQTYGSFGQFRVSHAQKSLALLLKYYWCAGERTAPPPFCPLDRRVLWEAGIRDKWTELDDMKKYVGWLRKLVAVACGAGYASLAEWELATYS